MSSGRKPRSARARRREEERRESARYRRLYARARTLTYEPGELDQAIGAQPQLLDAALMGRYATRRALFGGCRELLPAQGRLALALIPATDAVLVKAGADWSPAPDCWGRPTWPDMLRWGLDKAADTCRLLRVGLTYGAVVLARAQLERWTLNVAHHHQVDAMTDAESAADYVRRVWSVYPKVAESFDVGLAWNDLSEWLHGRGQVTAALSEIADAANLAGPGALPAMTGVHERVSALAEVVLCQVRGGVTLLAEEHYGDKFTAALQMTPRPDKTDETEPPHLASALDALDFQAVFGEKVRGRSAGLSPTGCSWATRPLQSCSQPARRRGLRRVRCSSGGAGPCSGRGRRSPPSRKLSVTSSTRGTWRRGLFRYIAIGEAAFLAAGWGSGPEADALRTATAALQSAWWLWLEDTDDAMPCVRGVLEQACRARAHRVKPARAARVEDMGAAAGPARWLEAAGWRRLAVLGRALGEFAHVSFRARWSGARDALAALQASGISQPDSTAREHALDASAHLLAHEVAARLDLACPAVAATFRARVTQLDTDRHEQYVEELLQRSLDLRTADFGPPDLQPLPTSA